MPIQKVISFILICILYINSSFSQNERNIIDSLKLSLIGTSKEEKIDIYLDLSQSYWYVSTDTGLIYANQALNIALELDDKVGISDAFNRIGNVYYFQEDIDQSLYFYKKSLAIRKNQDDYKRISGIYNNIALIYMDQEQPETALEFYYKALEISKKNNDLDDIIDFTLSIGDVFNINSNYKEALKNFQSALELTEELGYKLYSADLYRIVSNIYMDIAYYDKALENILTASNYYHEINDSFGIAIVYNDMGLIYHSLGNYSEATEYIRKSISYHEVFNDLDGISGAFNNLGIIYDDQNQNDSAIYYYQKSFEISKQINDKEGIATSLNNIGLIYLEQGKSNTALDYLMRSINISKEINDRASFTNTLNNIGRTLIELGEIDAAYKKVNEAIALAEVLDTKDFLLEGYSLMSLIKEKQGKYKEALHFHKLYKQINDTIYSNESSKRIAEMQVKYQTESVENDNEILRKDNEIQHLQIKKQVNLKWFFIAIAILVFIMSALILYGFQLKHKTNNLLKKKNSELENTNAKLKESEKSLKELNVTKDKFFSIIAHDLKNPFQALLGFSDLLFKNSDKLTKKEVHEYSKAIYNSSHNLFDLLGNLLHWSRAQLGSIKYSPEKLLVRDEVAEVISVLSINAEEKKINIISNIEDSIKVEADKNVVHTVLRNLLSNAIKFTDQNGEIEVSATKDNHFIRFSVKDTGNGISEENLEKLFQLESSYSTLGTLNEEGTGLGLILSKELLENCKGEITVESELGKGSTFSFTLPRA